MRTTKRIMITVGIAVMICAGLSSGQSTSEIYLIKVRKVNGAYLLERPKAISTSEGYNNQPSFHPDAKSILFSSGSGSNTEILRYYLDTGVTDRLTDTPEAEYSPLIMPDGEHFSVIQLIVTEGERKGAQPLTAFPLAGGAPGILYENGEKVGYHAWIDRNRLALFILGSPHFLRLVDLESGKTDKITENIGRSLYKIPGRNAISFSKSRERGPDTISIYHLDTGQITPVIDLKGDSGFYAWTGQGDILTGDGSKLYKYSPGKDMEWIKIGDYKDQNISNITRIAVAPGDQWLALVNQK